MNTSTNAGLVIITTHLYNSDLSVSRWQIETSETNFGKGSTTFLKMVYCTISAKNSYPISYKTFIPLKKQ